MGAPTELALIGSLAGVVAYAALALFSIYGWLTGLTGRTALTTALVTAVWFALPLYDVAPLYVQIGEAVMIGCWYGYVLRILGFGFDTLTQERFRDQRRLALAGVLLVGSSIGAWFWLSGGSDQVPAESVTLLLTLEVLMSIFGLVLVEQLFRNTRTGYQWHVKFFSIGFAIVFGYDFYLYSDALLFQGIDPNLWQLRGIVFALAVPFLVVASLRNRKNQLNLHLSQRFVFRTGGIMLAGGYLLFLALGGYYLQLVGGEWGAALRTLFVIIAAIAFVVAAVSKDVRDRLWVVLSKNLFEYKFDYREEWTRITDNLASSSSEEAPAVRAIRSLAGIAHCHSGAIWELTSTGQLVALAQFERPWTEPFSKATSAALHEFFGREDWIVDLDSELPVTLPPAVLDELRRLEGARFVIPLNTTEQLFGIAILARPTTPQTYIWEDYDLLKIAARQVASYLAQLQAASMLARNQQFSAMHQMSAFIVHDLKTVVAQLKLLVDNAERHKHNPAFVDDMVKTTDNAVARMEKLLVALRNPDPQQGGRVRVGDIMEAAVAAGRGSPDPVLAEGEANSLELEADGEQLATIVGHLVRNAQEATTDDGHIELRAERDGGWLRLQVVDDGSGMTEAFVRDRLFQPFESTKGLTGMGIGVYQAREFVRSLGGDLSVASTPGEGSCFTISLPIASEAVEETIGA